MKKVKKTNKQLTPQQALAKKKQKQKIIKICLTVFVLLVASAGVYLGFGIFKQVEGFSKEKLLNNESSIQVSANGEEYYSYGQDGIRKNVSYDDIPQVMIDAVVAAEDSRFFEHNGFDLPRIVKAFMGNLVAGRITGGGSTITQQVIKKSYYPKEEQTIERKAGEIILAIEATSQTTKQEILELYLNKIYFGYGNKAIGIYAASKYYFDKEVQNLTLPEAALLAGTLNSPNKYDPFKNLKLAQERRDTILDLMEMHGYISKEECAATKAVPVENTLKSNPVSGSGKYQAYADKVTREVFEKTGYDPNTTPMKITTYINTDLQSKLNDISNGDGFKF
ncbi:MAG: transglycosylase domain-containing protein [Longibaculum sp.]